MNMQVFARRIFSIAFFCFFSPEGDRGRGKVEPVCDFLNLSLFSPDALA